MEKQEMDEGANQEKKETQGANFAESNMNDENHEIVTSESKTPLKPHAREGEVKFIVNDSINGDAKVDIDNMKTFAGMAKEELLKYTNDPFWVRMRLFLFIFFWAVWIAMFVGAIAIVVMAPRCESPKPKKWFETGPIIQAKSEKLADLEANLPYLSDLKVKGLVLPALLKVDEEETVVDFKGNNEEWGTLEMLKKLTAAAKNHGVHIILNFIPNHSSDQHVWFNKSLAGEKPYTDYYVWAPQSGTAPDGTPLPPNNWLSVTGGSAWEWKEERQQYYLHQFEASQPDLNYHNKHVLKEMNDTLSFWLDAGVTSFVLDKAQYLLEDINLQNETVGGKPGSFHNEYDFYGHHRTYNLPGVANILASWRSLIQDKTAGEGMLAITGEVPIPMDSKENDTVVTIDLVWSSPMLESLPTELTASDLYNKLVPFNLTTEWTAMPLTHDLLADKFSEDAVDPVNMITFLLPVTPVSLLGDVLGLHKPPPDLNLTEVMESQKNEKESNYKTYKSLVTMRGSPTIMHGSTLIQEVDNVVMVSRTKQGSPGYLVAYNPNTFNTTTDFSKSFHLADELTVHLRSSNYQVEKPAVKDKVEKGEIFLPGQSAIMFTFVPPAN